MLNQFYSNDLDTSEAPAFLGCFNLPEPLGVQLSSVQFSRSLVTDSL